MIAPNKHTDINTSVLYVAGLALKEISKSGIVKFDDLKRAVTSKVGGNLGYSFEYAVSFLFLLDRIVYNQSSDTFSLTL